LDDPGADTSAEKLYRLAVEELRTYAVPAALDSVLDSTRALPPSGFPMPLIHGWSLADFCSTAVRKIFFVFRAAPK